MVDNQLLLLFIKFVSLYVDDLDDFSLALLACAAIEVPVLELTFFHRLVLGIDVDLFYLFLGF